jgi:hypothetical protein
VSKVFAEIVVTAVFLAVGSAITTAVADDAPVATQSARQLTAGLTPLAQLLQLMDTDKNGKVSKDEFMRYMVAQFDFADKNKDGELDPSELKAMVYRLNHPSTRIPPVRK